MYSRRAAVSTVILTDKLSMWRVSNESRGFVPLLVHKQYIEHLSNSSISFISFEGNIYIAIIIELSPSPSLMAYELTDRRFNPIVSVIYGNACFLSWSEQTWQIGTCSDGNIRWQFLLWLYILESVIEKYSKHPHHTVIWQTDTHSSTVYSSVPEHNPIRGT